MKEYKITSRLPPLEKACQDCLLPQYIL